MSALNAFHTQDEQYAYLATDGASFDYADGKVASLGTKVAAFPQFSIAFAMSGPLIINYIMADVQSKVCRNQGDIMVHLCDAFQEARRGMSIGKPEGEATGANELTMLAIAYLKSENRPAVFRLDSRPKAVTGQIPFVWHEIDGTYIPPCVSPAIAKRGGWVAHAVNDSRGLFRAQRKFKFETMPGASVAVGGTCTLWRVGPDGIAAWDILEFGDEIGKRADPTIFGQNIIRPVPLI